MKSKTAKFVIIECDNIELYVLVKFKNDFFYT